MNGEEILELSMDDNDADAKSIKEYLKCLLEKMWDEGESFSGKRPLGNSGWEFELYKPLIQHGLVDGELDENGCIETVDDHKADELIFDAISSL